MEISQILDRSTNPDTFVAYQELKRFTLNDCTKSALKERTLMCQKMIPHRGPDSDSPSDTPYQMRKLISDYSRAALEEVIKRCTDKSVNIRYSDEEEFFKTLRANYTSYAVGHLQRPRGCPEYPLRLTPYEEFIINAN